jgi:hypothetical protein
MKITFYKKRWFKIPYTIVLYGFALYGFILCAAYFAVYFNWTNESGSVDANNRYFEEMHNKYNQNFKVDSASVVKHKFEVMNRVMLLNNYYPQNANYILNVYNENKDERLALRMLDAVDLRLKKNKKYMRDVAEMNANLKRSGKQKGISVFEWMNIAEWKDFKIAVAKDKPYIDSVAMITGVEPRLIVACLVGEQIRLFNSSRESYKRYMGPLKVLALENRLSYGVTGIKNNTAINIENYAKDPKSEFYPGKAFEHLLDFDSTVSFKYDGNDTLDLRLQRLVQFKNHYYSYLYAAMFLREIKAQWERAGYPIDDRPEILASLFNLGFHKSKPKAHPAVGGSVYKIHDTEYTFGAVAYEFFYSGELADVFPYKKKSFDYEPIVPQVLKKKEDEDETNP